MFYCDTYVIDNYVNMILYLNCEVYSTYSIFLFDIIF